MLRADDIQDTGSSCHLYFDDDGFVVVSLNTAAGDPPWTFCGEYWKELPRDASGEDLLVALEQAWSAMGSEVEADRAARDASWEPILKRFRVTAPSLAPRVMCIIDRRSSWQEEGRQFRFLGTRWKGTTRVRIGEHAPRNKPMPYGKAKVPHDSSTEVIIEALFEAIDATTPTPPEFLVDQD